MKQDFWLGLLLTAMVSALGIWTGGFAAVKQIGFSAVTMSIIIGMLIGNTLYPKIAKKCHSGVNFSKAKLLRLGIILYGFHLTFQEVLQVGSHAIVADALIVITTFILAWMLGKYVMHMDEQTTILMGAGASICGAAAVMATEPVVKAPADKVAVAVATVVIFGTIGMFLYPEMYRLGLWTFSEQTYGIYIGSSVHEVAQVYAAGKAISQSVADAAVTTKMIRVVMLAPFLFALSWWLAKREAHKQHGKKQIVIPWFALWFIVVAAFNSLHLLPLSWVKQLQFIDTILLTMAMAALGLTTHVGAIKQAGVRPLLLGLLLMVWLVIAGGVIQWLLM